MYVGLLRRITSLCSVICGQVTDICHVRYKQWQERSLRSRQRNTYIRMLHMYVAVYIGKKGEGALQRMTRCWWIKIYNAPFCFRSIIYCVCNFT